MTDWVVPCHGIIEATERGVKITGGRVIQLDPGDYFYHSPRTQVYVENVKRKVREPADVIVVTKETVTANGETLEDSATLRVGISLAFTITNITTWLVENEDAEQGLLLDVQRVVLKYARARTYQEFLEHDEADLTKFAQKELGRYFGVQIKQLGLTSIAETECRDLNHTGALGGSLIGDEEE